MIDRLIEIDSVDYDRGMKSILVASNEEEAYTLIFYGPTANA